MATKSKITDARREVLYAELHALLTAGLDFSHAFALLTEGEPGRAGERIARAVVQRRGRWCRVVAGHGTQRFVPPLDCGVVRIGEQTGACPRRSISYASITVNGPHSAKCSPRR